ncbi:MAG: hypothetical protein ACRD3B_11850 [Candidatus Sulfotelmatobacter sp.]
MPGNVWGIPSPPGDWFPVPGDPEPSSPAGGEPPAQPGKRPIEAIEKEGATASWDESEIASSSKTASKIDAGATTEKAQSADAQIVSGNTTLNAETRAVIEETVKVAVAQLTKSIVDVAREERVAAAAQLDAKVQQAVEAAVAKLPSPQRKRSKKKN